MNKIHRLSPQLIAKIAAGEVMERPAFAVKELIENALDAGATDIGIIIENAGLKRIQVSDNGEGMSKEDLEESWKPHTTSKMTEKDALIGIKTFGFRGEALASLAAVSHLTIQSRIKNTPTGNQIDIKNGKILKNHPVGMTQGTTVIAQNLFAEIPARKKFLKSISTEFRHIVDIVNHYAILYPTIQFSLKHNNRIILNYSHLSDRPERIKSIMSEETFSFFLPVKKINSYISISGFIAKPQINTSTQSKQLLFVNNRKINDKLISLAIKEAYGTMIESSIYPLFILFLDLPLEMVDVNVHPRKEQVAFLNNSFILQIVKEAISETLQENNITFQNLSWKRAGVGTTKSFAANLLRQTVLDKSIFIKDTTSPILQIKKLYLLYQTKDEIIILDQHAAHERILFEKLEKEFLKQKKKNKAIPLKEPYVLHIPNTEQLLLQEQRKIFEKLGFTFYFSKESQPHRKKQINSEDRIIVTHVPFLFQDRKPQELIKQLLEDIEEGIHMKDIDKVSEEMIAFLACRSAVKAGDILTENQMEKIIEELEDTPNNITCPHGRPTRISLSIHELNLQFKR